MKKGTDSASITFMLQIGFAVTSSMVVGYLCAERSKNLKHMMTMTGLRKDAYWTANFIVDYMKMLPACLVMILSPKIFKLPWRGPMITFIGYPLGNLPMLYCSSFLFSSESAG